MKKFNASLDMLAMVITIAVTVLFVSLFYVQISLFKSGNYLIPSTVGIICLVTYIGSFLLSTRSYTVSENGISINRWLNTKFIPFSDLIGANKIESGQMGFTLRTFGVGGLFGYYGYFSNSTFGNMVWYTTRRSKMVMLTTQKHKKIVLSPDDPDDFLRTFHQYYETGMNFPKFTDNLHAE